MAGRHAQRQLQHQPKPPTMPFLSYRPAQAKAGADLAAAVASTPAAAEVAQRWNALTADDKRQLEAASAAMQQARYPEPDDVRGDEDFRQLAARPGWSEYILHDTLRSLPGRARAFTDALADADRLIQAGSHICSASSSWLARSASSHISVTSTSSTSAVPIQSVFVAPDEVQLAGQVQRFPRRVPDQRCNVPGAIGVFRADQVTGAEGPP